MSSEQERYRRLHEIYVRACAIESEDERRAYIERACAGDDAMREEAAALLRLGRDEAFLQDFLDTFIDQRREEAEREFEKGPASVEAGDGPIPQRIADYEVRRVIGRGGMGVVYEAEQRSPKRRVAIKIIAPSAIAPGLLRRFQHESEVLGRLQHPGIGQIYEAGTCNLGSGPQPFFAMEYIEGETLLAYCEARTLGTRDRLELLSRVCDAVQHAHQRGVIHRDLKPANILVTPDGQPKVLDFGVARATGSDLQATTLMTNAGALVGTVPYMSPEQARGDASSLDTRSDVYALGVLAYQLLTDRLPYDLTDKMVHEAVRVIVEDEPSAMSSIDRSLRGDVETIVGKALEKEPARRYESASAFASDIRRYLNDEPVSARPPSAAYQFRKYARRNRAAVGGAAAVFVALIAGTIVSTAFAVRAERARADAAGALVERDEALEAERLRNDDLEAVNEYFFYVMGQMVPDEIGDTILELELASIDETPLVELSEQERVDAKATFERVLSPGVRYDVARRLIRDVLLERVAGGIEKKLADRPQTHPLLNLSLARRFFELGFYEETIVWARRTLALFDEYGSERAWHSTAVGLLVRSCVLRDATRRRPRRWVTLTRRPWPTLPRRATHGNCSS